MARFDPRRPYVLYKLPVFIIGATDNVIILRSELGDCHLKRLEDWDTSSKVIYTCLDPDALCVYGRPELWRIRTWNGRVSRLEYGPVRILPLTANGWDDTIPDYFQAIDELGVAASSVNTMSLNLWKRTLTKIVGIGEWGAGDLLGPLAILSGGRKEAKRGVYRNRVDYDIVQAYPTALAQPIPTGISKADSAFLRHMDWNAWEGILTARVRIPTMEWGPLPVVLDRKAELSCYGYTRPDGWTTVTLPLSELRMARELGCDVEPLTGSIGVPDGDLFGAWYKTIVPILRGLPGIAGAIGKLTANRLWSCFAVSPSGVRREHTFTPDGVMISADVPPDPAGQVERRSSTVYLGAIVQSRVRQRLYREGLQVLKDVVYIDTDGVIAKESTTPDGWQVKARMRWLDVAGAQAVNYYCDKCLPAPTGHQGPHWTVAGATSLEAKSRLFKQIKEGALTVSTIGNTLPAMDVNDAEAFGTNDGHSAALLFFDTART